jgi:hypothetical protein
MYFAPGTSTEAIASMARGRLWSTTEVVIGEIHRIACLWLSNCVHLCSIVFIYTKAIFGMAGESCKVC